MNYLERCEEFARNCAGFLVDNNVFMGILLGSSLAVICILREKFVARRMERDPAYARLIEEQTRKNCNRLFRP